MMWPYSFAETIEAIVGTILFMLISISMVFFVFRIVPWLPLFIGDMLSTILCGCSYFSGLFAFVVTVAACAFGTIAILIKGWELLASLWKKLR